MNNFAKRLLCALLLSLSLVLINDVKTDAADVTGILTVNTPVNILDESGTVRYTFTPDTDGKYVFLTIGEKDTYGELYVDNCTISDNDGGAGLNFEISENLCAGDECEITVKSFSGGVLETTLIVCDYNYYYEHYYQAPPEFIIEDGVLIRYNGTNADVVIPDGVTSIDYRLFEEYDEEENIIKNSNITSVTLPESVTEIEAGTFAGCRNLTNIYVSENSNTYTSKDGCLYTKDMKTLVCCPSGKETVTIPNTVTAIGEKAFGWCGKLTEITIPDSVTSIEDSAFLCCTGLSELTIPNSVKIIKAAAFSSCTSLKSMEIPDSVTSLDTRMLFEGCCSLTRFTIPDYVAEVGVAMFEGCSSLESIVIPENVKSIREYSFSGCSNLTHVVVPSSVTEIRTYSFVRCTNLESIVIPSSVKLIEDDIMPPFWQCKKVTIYGETGSYAQEYANSHDIPFCSISGSETLSKDISSCQIILSVASAIYTGAAHTPSVTVKDGSKDLMKDRDYTVEYKNNINVGTAQIVITGKDNYTGTVTKTFAIIANTGGSAGNTNTGSAITEKNGINSKDIPAPGTVLLDKTTKANYKVAATGSAVSYLKTTDKKAKSVKIPSTVTIDGITYKVTSIAADAFKNNKNLQIVTMQGNVTTIGSNAFYGCKKLSSVTLGKNITTIGNCAFQNCTALKKITIPSKVKKIGSKVFYNCKKLSSIAIKTKKLTANTVGSKAFTKAGNSNYKKLNVKVPSSKYKSYKTLLKKRGVSTKVKVKKG